MRCTVFYLAALALMFNGVASRRMLSTRTTDQNLPVPPEYTIQMPIDHFNTSDTRMYSNRYWINDTYYKAGGPVIFYDIGEQGAYNFLLNVKMVEGDNMDSAPMQLARKFNGLAIAWEHRFYGESQPFPVNQETGQRPDGYAAYKYLTIDQALQDTVYFANHFQPKGFQAQWSTLSPKKTPWVWVGGSYPGARGAYARLLSPETWYAVWASSAPVQEVVDFSAYFDPIYDAMTTNCSADMHAIVDYVDDVFLNGSPQQMNQLSELFALIPSAATGSTSQANVSELVSANAAVAVADQLEGLFGLFQTDGFSTGLLPTCNYIEQYNPAAQTYTGNNVSILVDSIAANPDNATASERGIFATHGATAAIEAVIYALVKQLQDLGNSSSPSSPFGASDFFSWSWQICSEFGGWQLSNISKPTNMVSRFINEDEFERNRCQFFFSFPQLPSRPNVTNTNTEYGGWNMRPSNVFFANGEFDPWRPIGVASQESDGPNRLISATVPKCNQPPPGSSVFGVVYPNAVHVSDLQKTRGTVNTTLDVGLEMFSCALTEWMTCFQPS